MSNITHLLWKILWIIILIHSHFRSVSFNMFSLKVVSFKSGTESIILEIIDSVNYEI